MRTLLTAVLVCSAGVVGHLVMTGTGTTAAAPNCHATSCAATIDSPVPPEPQSRGLVVHEWGTFTSFSGSNGVPVAFTPNNTDLPWFVYLHDANVKSDRFDQGGTVSMETPVIYFYADKETRASVRVDFPKGWITEWYPFASTVPGKGVQRENTFAMNSRMGETIRWNFKISPGEPAHFPEDRSQNPYYHARETDATPLQVEFNVPENDRGGLIRGAALLQREKFLFYRGVGAFPPPVALHALGGGKVRVTNAAGGKLTGMVLVTVRDGATGFRALEDLDSGAETVASLPEVDATTTGGLTEVVAKGLTRAGLYEREAQAMVKTWNAAWFQEEGSRLLYLVPRAKTDELLPLTVDPKPTDVVRVLVGRHDFLTPEQEAMADQQLDRLLKAQAEKAAADKELSRLGRFSQEARRLAGERIAVKQK